MRILQLTCDFSILFKLKEYELSLTEETANYCFCTELHFKVLCKQISKKEKTTTVS